MTCSGHPLIDAFIYPLIASMVAHWTASMIARIIQGPLYCLINSNIDARIVRFIHWLTESLNYSLLDCWLRELLDASSDSFID